MVADFGVSVHSRVGRCWRSRRQGRSVHRAGVGGVHTCSCTRNLKRWGIHIDEISEPRNKS